MDTPKVSVLMPTYNRERFITDAVRSVLAQDYGNIELVIVDDGSTDRTAEILVEQFSDYMTGVPVDGKTICYYPSEHQGISGARNLALDKATGAYIAFLDADDRFHPNKLSLQMEYLQAHPEASIVFCGFENVEDFCGRPPTAAQAKLLADMDYGLCITLSCSKRELFDRFGGFDLSLATGEDYEWVCRIKMCGVDLSHALPQVLYHRRIHEGNITLTHDSHDPRELRSIWIKAIRNARARSKQNGNIRTDPHL